MYPQIPLERVVGPSGSAEHTFGTSDLKGKGNRARRPRGRVEVKLYSFFYLDARCRRVVNAASRLLYPGKDPVPIV